MKLRFFLGAAVACAMALVGATAASAHKFEFSSTGTVLGRALTTQKWIGPDIAVECSELAVTKGNIVSFSQENKLTITILYKKCAVGGTLKVENFNGEYMLEAEGSFSVLEPITMKTDEEGACTITVPSEGNQKLPLVYKNLKSREGNSSLEVVADATGLTSSGTGYAAGCTFNGYQAGRFSGQSELYLSKGNLGWK